jgi:hypothetical protein
MTNDPMQDSAASTDEDAYTWQVTNRQGKVTVSLGEEASKLPTNPVMHKIGELLIKLGTQLIQSHVEDEDDDYDE